MDLGLTNKCALVLASSQGLGLGVATALCAEGANVVLMGRGEERLATETAALNERKAGRAAYVVADLADPTTPERVLDAAQKFFGPIDILVNNSGGPAGGLASGVAAKTWDDEFAKMVLPIFEITRLAIQGMRARQWGRVITLASSGVVQPIPQLAVSNAMRSSVVSWMKTLSLEVAADGVTVNVVLPGRIDTPRVAQLDQAAAAKSGKPIADMVKASLATIPMGRYGRVDEFASVVAFLAGQTSSYVTGSVIRIDGGMIKAI